MVYTPDNLESGTLLPIMRRENTFEISALGKYSQAVNHFQFCRYVKHDDFSVLMERILETDNSAQEQECRESTFFALEKIPQWISQYDTLKNIKSLNGTVIRAFQTHDFMILPVKSAEFKVIIFAESKHFST